MTKRNTTNTNQKFTNKIYSARKSKMDKIKTKKKTEKIGIKITKAP